jgi:hypothetical protein
MRVSDQLFDFNHSISEQRTSASAKKNYGIIHIVYLAAIALATLGWLWLFVWIGSQLL